MIIINTHTQNTSIVRPIFLKINKDKTNAISKYKSKSKTT